MVKSLIKKILSAPDRIVGLNMRNFHYIYKLNNREDYRLANDKVMAKEFLVKHGLPTPETLQVYKYLSELGNFHHELTSHRQFVIKPSNGSRGNGILLIEEAADGHFHTPSGRVITPKEMRYFIASIIFGKYSMGQEDWALVEQLLRPCNEFVALSGNQGLPDIRILVIEERIVMGMLRLPTSLSDGKANLHQGGIGIGIDLETGRTTQAIFKGKAIYHHPDTHAELLGVQVPSWKEILQISREIAHKSPLKYIGIDLTIDEDTGPMVIEFNARPGLEIQNANAMGIRELL